MRLFLTMAVVVMLPSCAQTLTTCAQERAALREAGSAITAAARKDQGGFTARLASRGHATYHCLPGRSGQVRCSTAAPTASANIEDLYRKYNAAAARVSQACQG